MLDRMLRRGIQETTISTAISALRVHHPYSHPPNIRGQARWADGLCPQSACCSQSVSQSVRRLVTHWSYSGLLCDIIIWHFLTAVVLGGGGGDGCGVVCAMESGGHLHKAPHYKRLFYQG